MKDTFDALTSLHAHEEELRERSLSAIQASEHLTAHLQAVQGAMNHLHTLLAPDTEPETDEQAIQLICVRLFNVAATTLRLGLAGYYQASFQALRDALEVVNLLDLFRLDRSTIFRWRTADEKAWRTEFLPSEVRKRLETFSGFKEQQRHKPYKNYSNYAVHPNYKSFALLSVGGQVQVGPFFDELKLTSMLQELGAKLSHVTIVASVFFDTKSSPSLLIAKSEFLGSLDKYREKYIP